MASATPQILDRRATLSSANVPERISALDFTKGALVLLMLLYHWLIYFLSTEGGFYRYLRFVTPSFIFLSGFLVSNVYLAKYGINNPRLPARLVRRGLKILGLFIILNVFISALLRDSYTGSILFRFSISNLTAVFVTGNVLVAGGKAAAFYILVPISYVLLLSAALLVPARTCRHVFHISWLCCLMGMLVLHLLRMESANLDHITSGLLGAICGHLSLDKINALVAHWYVLLCAYCCYLVALTVWNASYPLQIIGVCLTLMLFFLLGTVRGEYGRTQEHIILLGKYSLFGYIAQIAVLQMLHRTLGHAGSGLGVLGMSFVGAFTLTIMSVVVLDRARRRSAVADTLYKAVFA